MLQNLVSSVQNKNTGGTSAATTAICNCLECLQCQVDDISSTVDGMSTRVNTCCVVANTGNISTVNANTVDTTSLTADTASISGTVTAACVSSTNASVDCINSDNITATCANVTNLTATNATINGSISPTSVTTSCVTATNACVATGSITNLTSTCVNACSLSGTSATVDIVNAACGNISHLVTDLIESDSITSTNANVTTLAATTGNINTVNANSVTASSIVSCYITADAIKADGTITTTGLTTEEGWYTLYIPPFNNFNLQLSGTWNNEEWGINIIGTSETSIVQATQRDLTTIKEVDFVAEGGTYIELRNDSTIKYILHYTDDNYTDSDITVELNTTPTVDYSYAPSKTKFYIFRGYENNSAEVVIPCLSKIFSIAAEEQAYERTTTDDIYINEHVYLTSDWDSGGQPTSCSPGEDNQYISVCNTGCTDVYGCDVCLATWKTPVDTTTGTLSDSTCLITERAVSTYNGTTNAGYPIVHLGDGTCAHGLATADCVCGTCCVETPVLNATNVYATSANVTCDVVIGGDLYVNGTSHIVDEETLEVQGDVLTIRANNPSALASGQVAGINVNKYDGTNSLSVVTDCTGTLRVGTGAGTDTAYTNIAFNADDNLWYDYDGTTYTEMATQPSGTMTSWEGKVEDAPYTRYDSVTFTVVDVTSLEPVLTRDEEADMEDGFVTKWDASNTKAVTTGAVCTHDVCTCGDINVTGSVTAASDITSSTSVTAPIVCGTTCVDTPYANAACICSTDCAHINDMCTEGNVTISGDLYVCGDTTIEGVMSSTKLLTAATSCDARYYPTFVENNNTTAGSEYYFTNGCVSVNPSTGTMYADYYKTNDGRIACTTISNLTAADIGLTAGCSYTFACVIAAIQNCFGTCASSYTFCSDNSCTPLPSGCAACCFVFSKLDNNEIGTDCYQTTLWRITAQAGSYYVKESTSNSTSIVYSITEEVAGIATTSCASAVPVALTNCTKTHGCVCYSACCPLCFTPTTGLLSSTCLCATSCVSTPVVKGTTYVCGAVLYAGCPSSCTSSVAGVAGGRYDQGYMELYAATPYIDFHKNMYCGDYSQRIASNTDSLSFLITNGYGCTTATASATYYMCANGIFKGNGLCGSCWVCTPTLCATTVICSPKVVSNRIHAYATCLSEGVNCALITTATNTCGYGYYGGSYIGHDTTCTTDGSYWGFATFGFYNNETGCACPGLCVSITGQTYFYNNLCVRSNLRIATNDCLGLVYGIGNDLTACCCNMAIGSYNTVSNTNAVAVGYCNTASGSSSVAFGRTNTASGTTSVAVGSGVVATGESSSALGRLSCACAAQASSLGFGNVTTGVYASSVGTLNCASGTNASAVGYSNSASCCNSSALGFDNTASGCQSVAVGFSNTATCLLSIAIGASNCACVNGATAIGRSNIASAGSSTALGLSNTASGEYSSAFGSVNTASGEAAFAAGRCNTASGTYATAVGYCSVANASGVAIGANAIAQTNSVAIGICSVVYGSKGVAVGCFARACCECTIAIGCGAISNGISSISIGTNNTASGAMSNAFGYGNTVSGCLSSAVGFGNTASGAMTAAVGYNNTASLLCASAIGISNTVSATCSSAVGWGNTVSGNYSSAFGICNNATCARSYVYGGQNTVNGCNTAVVGSANTVYADNSIALGRSNNVCSPFGTVIGINSSVSSVCGGLAIGARATSGTCCGIVWSTINTSCGDLHGRHGMINLTIPSCAYHCDINIALRYIFTDVINNGRCTYTWDTSCTLNLPTLRAAFYGYRWDDGGSTDGTCRYASGINCTGSFAEIMYVNNGAAACSTLSTCQLLYTCGCKIRTSSHDWGGYSCTSVWNCGLQGIIVY